MAQLIEGKVAQILSENCIIINVGAQAGVKVGMAFAVLARGEEVKDPESGEALGRWEVPKGHIRVTHVQERLATCEGFMPGHTTQAEDPSTQVLSAAMITHSMRPETWRGGAGARLNVNRAELSGMPAFGPISVGDPVCELRPESAQQESAKTDEPTGETQQPRPTEEPQLKPDEKASAP